MTQNDAELIQQILQGDQDAFTSLVNKYQKGVHALVWRKIGDFHIAQEITQDTFLKAYQNLGDLKNHNLFAGWLYVIAARLCYDWHQKNAMPIEFLDNIDANEVDRVSYSQYIADKQATEADETRREVVKKLLQKLPESERTVITLFYLGEMTIKAIGDFLGISPNTVKSRLSRARDRLKKEEDMIQQNLSSFQLPEQLTENIMREVSRIVPTAPTANKPILPWALSAASAVLILLLMGVGTQYLSRFQKPYNLNATSEPTVEIIEALFVYDSPVKPAVRNQAGSSAIPGENPGAGQQPDARLFAAAAVDETEISTQTPQWTQTKGPEGGIVKSLFTTNSGDVYAGTPTALYKLTDDGRTWRHVNAKNALSLQDWIAGGIQMAEHHNMLYLATNTEVLASADNGETWESLGTHPEGGLRGFVVTDSGFYLALMDNVYYSKDGRTSWEALKDGMEAEKVGALAAVENTVFAGTSSGLYRLSAETWELLSVGPADLHGEKPVIHALAASKHRLYVAAGKKVKRGFGAIFRSKITDNDWWSLYRSTDLGGTWYAIDPRERTENERKQKDRQKEGITFTIKFPVKNEAEQKDGIKVDPPIIQTDSTPSDFTSNIKIIAVEGRVMLAGSNELFYSVNAGETWVSVDLEDRLANDTAPPIVMSDAGTFYRGGKSGVYRTTDAGESWDQFNTGLASTTVMYLFALNGKLYAFTTGGLATSTDAGESWSPLLIGTDGITLMAEFDGGLYMKATKNMKPQFFRLSTENDRLIRIPEMSLFFQKVKPLNMDEKINMAILEAMTDAGKQNLEEGKPPNPEDVNFVQIDDLVNQAFQEQAANAMQSAFGHFAVSGETYYVEYEQKLFRWKPGVTEWHNTGLVDTAIFSTASSSSNPYDSMGFKIAVSGNTIYVGRRDKHLSQSFDEGETWNDVTLDLPFAFVDFKAIAFAGSTVYVATNKGVAYSEDGTTWHAATDVEGGQLVMEKLAVEGTTVYGTTGQHVYQLKENSSTWKQVTPEIPDAVLSFVVDGNTLYVGTASSGVLRFALDE